MALRRERRHRRCRRSGDRRAHPGGRLDLPALETLRDGALTAGSARCAACPHRPSSARRPARPHSAPTPCDPARARHPPGAHLRRAHGRSTARGPGAMVDASEGLLDVCAGGECARRHRRPRTPRRLADVHLSARRRPGAPVEPAPPRPAPTRRSSPRRSTPLENCEHCERPRRPRARGRPETEGRRPLRSREARPRPRRRRRPRRSARHQHLRAPAAPHVGVLGRLRSRCPPSPL